MKTSLENAKIKCSNEFRRKKHTERSTMKRGGDITAVKARGKPRVCPEKTPLPRLKCTSKHVFWNIKAVSQLSNSQSNSQWSKGKWIQDRRLK